MAQPLDGIRVVDWTIWQFGPVCSKLLSDLGAEVIKIESRQGDPGRDLKGHPGSPASLYGEAELNYYFENCNRNKKSVTVDLKTEEGRQIVYRLVSRSDVFVHNFRSSVPEKLGMSYEILRGHNHKLIYAAACGYGTVGPDKGKPAYDPMGLARSGFMHLVGEPGMPPMTIAAAVADQIGAVFLAYGVLAAIVARERGGVGQRVDVSHFGSMITLLSVPVNCALVLGKRFYKHERARARNPLFNWYCCQDGRWIDLGMIEPDRYWHDFCKVLGIERLENDPKFKDAGSRRQNNEEAVRILDEVFATKPRDEWVKLLDKDGDFIFTYLNDVTEVGDDPMALANDYVIEIDHPEWGHVKQVGFPITLSETPLSFKSCAPTLGQDTDKVLSGICGFNDKEIAAFRKREII